MYVYIIQLAPQRGFSVTDYIKYYAYVLPTKSRLIIFITIAILLS